jgi:thiol-disulfide isomerase/thioredoxin
MTFKPLIPTLLLVLIGTTSHAQEAVKIGEAVGKLRFTDIRYLRRTLDDFGPKKAFVLVFTNTSCPLVQRYLPTLQTLAGQYKEVQFVALNAAEEDSIIAMATQAVQFDMDIPFVKDQNAVCARALGVTRTPEGVVLDGERRLRYRGRIDDQYRLGGARKEPTSHDLKDALDAVLAGKNVARAETEVDGCPITFPAERKPRSVTYAEHVAPILYKHCVQCHQPGGSAPFSLATYQQASTRATALAEVIVDQRMPPWFAGHEFGPFANHRGLSSEERQTVLDWTRTGRVQGDAGKSPQPPKAPPGKWRIAAPDLVLESEEFELPAAGDIPYKYALLPHVFPVDTWIRGAEIVSDNPRALHHCNMAYANLTEGFSEANFITGSVPGGSPMWLDSGTAFRIPKGSILAVQMHYVATGKPEKCRVHVGLRYPREVVQKRLQHMQISNNRFTIPPEAAAHKVSASRVLNCDAEGVGLFAHMHLRGKDMTFTAHLPAGRKDTLLIIPNYNFAWQIAYQWQTGAKKLPKGTRLECIAHFDNSAFNPYNPNPLATVRHGPQTYHEMMYGFFFYTDAAEQLGLRVDSKTGAARQGDK